MWPRVHHDDRRLVQPVLALIAGVLILLMPRLLNYVVAAYLILIGLSGILAHLGYVPIAA